MSAIGTFRGVSTSVFETAADPVTVFPDDIVALVNAARLAPSGRARLLLHDGKDDKLHEMVIALPSDSCDHPHINFNRGSPSWPSPANLQ
jgi:hypothetical protein